MFPSLVRDQGSRMEPRSSHLNNPIRQFGLNTSIASLNEPLPLQQNSCAPLQSLWSMSSSSSAPQTHQSTADRLYYPPAECNHLSEKATNGAASTRHMLSISRVLFFSPPQYEADRCPVWGCWFSSFHHVVCAHFSRLVRYWGAKHEIWGRRPGSGFMRDEGVVHGR